MPKSSKSLFVLIPVVAIIWGLVIYRIVEALSDNDDIGALSTTSNSGYKYVIERDTFSLIDMDRDPFLGKIYKEKKSVELQNRPAPSEIEWPAIEYQGMVSDTDAKSKVYLIKINGKSFFLKEGASAESVRLVKGSVNKVRLRYKGSTKVF